MNEETERKAICLLIAEDDSDDRYMIQQACNRSNHLFIPVFLENGEELVNYLSCKASYEDRDPSDLPDLLLLDLNMPKINGIEALRMVREKGMCKELPVVVLTTSESNEDMYDTFNLGINSFITKPSDFQELVKTMDELGNLIS